MTREDKDLLLKDLSARLPYGVKIRIEYPFLEEKDWCPEDLYGLDLRREVIAGTSVGIEEFKPYLRPMSSITVEELEFLFDYLPYDFTRIYSGEFDLEDIHFRQTISIDDMAFLLDCLNKWHFDYRGLIEKGLALKAPEGMYI